MSYLNYQKDCQIRLEHIKNKNASKIVKIQLLQSFLQTLKGREEMEKKKVKENESTSFSENQSNFSVYEREIQELQEKILQKRAIKFEVNEQIEGTEDNLYQIEKVIDTKRQYDESLKKQVNRKIQWINEENKKIPQKQKSYINKSIGVVSDLLKGWLS